MELTDTDREILTWLRGLGSEPDYMYQTNVRSYDQAARKAAEIVKLPVGTIRDRLLALEQEGFVEIVSRPGYTGIHYTRITDEGRQKLREPVRRTDETKPIIFVSCGQTSDEERELGAMIVNIINQETPAEAYYAENQATFAGVSSHILDSLARCVGFVGIMHYRGLVTEPDDTSYQRASVWIEQEISIAAYRIHTLKEAIPVQLYIQRGIKREGLRDKIMLNPTTFDTNEEVVKHFRSVVKARFGGLPKISPHDLRPASPLGEKQRRVSLQRSAINPDFDVRIEVKPALYRPSPARIDGAVQKELEAVVDETEKSRDGSSLREHLAANASPQGIWFHGASPEPQMGQRPPLPFREVEIYSDGEFIVKYAQQDADTLAQVIGLLGDAYHLMRRVYQKFDLPFQGRATLDFNLHAGRTRYNPVLVGGRWTADVDASKSFEEAFADITLLLTREAGLNWSLDEIHERLRAHRERHMPETGAL